MIVKPASSCSRVRNGARQGTHTSGLAGARERQSAGCCRRRGARARSLRCRRARCSARCSRRASWAASKPACLLACTAAAALAGAILMLCPARAMITRNALAYAPWGPAQWHEPVLELRSGLRAGACTFHARHAPCHDMQGPAVGLWQRVLVSGQGIQQGEGWRLAEQDVSAPACTRAPTPRSAVTNSHLCCCASSLAPNVCVWASMHRSTCEARGIRQACSLCMEA